MRLVRFGPAGEERPGLLQQDWVVDLRSVFADIPDIGESFFRDGWLAKVSNAAGGARVPYERLGCPIRKPGKIICLGRNYLEHAQEGGIDLPEKPLLFAKAPNSINGPTDPILLPRSCGQVDWEVELAVIIGKEGKRIPESAAFDHIAGVTVMNDVSGRQAQYADGQWFRGKSFDTFAPMGPAIVTLDEIGDVQNLRLRTLVDGQVMHLCGNLEAASGHKALHKLISFSCISLSINIIITISINIEYLFIESFGISALNFPSIVSVIIFFIST